MDYDALIATGVRTIPVVSEFCSLFPNAEHVIVKAKRDMDGWRVVHEWISRCPIRERYVLWLSVAISTEPSGSLNSLEKPRFHITELAKFDSGKGDPGGAQWELGQAEFEDGDWEQLVATGGDFAAIGLELTVDSPVPRFATFWNDTRPAPIADPPDGMAFKTPLRFEM
jgi:hypothetical protein